MLKSEFCGWENKQYFALLEIMKKKSPLFPQTTCRNPLRLFELTRYKSTVMQLCEAVHRHGNTLS